MKLNKLNKIIYLFIRNTIPIKPEVLHPEILYHPHYINYLKESNPEIQQMKKQKYK